ncbi:Protein FAM161A [Papilio xuthus]|uniref:Protein FAM161A n=1 Tax=Papilio xuthus TaxID=66420 RepID=A0A194PHZ8_PAPXU|nr:Protein FAM161A [Papilio xuthus]
MPKTAYERINKTLVEQQSIDSSTCVTPSPADVYTENVKDFYRSIPDYNDINHLPSSEFYSTLKKLREKKRAVLGLPAEYTKEHFYKNENHSLYNKQPSGCSNDGDDDKCNKVKNTKPNNIARRKKSVEKKDIEHLNLHLANKTGNIVNDKIPGSCLKVNQTKSQDLYNKDCGKSKSRNHSACSISWHDDKVGRDKCEIDKKFAKFFQLKDIDSCNRDEFRTQSMPSSPLRSKSFRSSSRNRKTLTIPKPFKMTLRDDDERIVNGLRTIQKSFSDDMLDQKRERKQFRARPVPIESRIPLYDKILEDQAMRRAITKINSEAELRAQMKPFSFTRREENGMAEVCERAVHILPKPKKKKRFKARPVPKNLFSNYFYDKKKQDEFFRSMNRRIRSEEMLRSANYPGSMATRDRSRLSTPAAHSDLPVDPSPAAPSTLSSDRARCSSPSKGCKSSKDDFITTSPQPFRFKTAARANQKMLDIAQKVYQSGKNTDSISDCIAKPRVYSALELKGAAAGRSNLAALLRAESVRRRFEIEAANSLAEQRRRIELRQRDRQLRSKPAWHLVKNNHEEDIAMRLQTRRDEERMRREEFLHEMELMYGRVQQQPLLFERYYAPRSYSPCNIRLSPRKGSGKKRGRRNSSYHLTTSSDGFESDVQKCMDKIDNDDKVFENSDDIIGSIDRRCL